MPVPDKRDRFGTTRWSLVLAAGGQRSPSADEALASLFETYWYPLFAFLKGRGHSPDEAEDLVQAFFVYVLEKRTLHHVDPTRGRFRSFLLTSLRNFAANEYDRQSAKKRGGGTPVLSLEVQTAEGRFQLEPPTYETPEKVFDRRWAMILLDRALHRLREEITPAKAPQFDQLKVYLTGDRTTGGYAQAAAALGMSEGAVRIEVHRMRRRFRDLVYEEIAHTVSNPADIDDEMRHLRSSVGR